MTTAVFTWKAEKDWRAPNGLIYVLRCPLFPKGSLSPLCGDDRVASCAWRNRSNGGWAATFWRGFDVIERRSLRASKAMRDLETELDRQSIGIFGFDDVVFLSPDSPVMTERAYMEALSRNSNGDRTRLAHHHGELARLGVKGGEPIYAGE